MKLKATKIMLAVMTIAGMSAISGTAAAFDLTNCGFTGIYTNFDGTANADGKACPWVQYGDALSFNLAVNGSLYNLTYGGGTTAGSAFYVDSSPGQLHDLVVNATGVNGGPTPDNIAGMDDAYATPNSDGSVFFTTNKDAYGYISPATTPPEFLITPDTGVFAPADPGDTFGKGKASDEVTHVVEFTGDNENTWDTTLTALQTALGTGASPIFFFNNNQTNSPAGDTPTADQSLAVWAQITLTGAGKTTLYFDFTNNEGTYFGDPLGGGTLFGSASTFTSDGNGPLAGTNAETDYVLSGGQTCFDPDTGSLSLPVGGVCLDPVGDPIPGNSKTVNNNLGANQAAYAVLFPELNAILLSAGFDGYQAMHVDLRYGCDPNTVDKLTNCVARSANNGYEQLFMGAITGTTVRVPEPATIALLGMGLLGLGWSRRRRTAV